MTGGFSHNRPIRSTEIWRFPVALTSSVGFTRIRPVIDNAKKTENGHQMGFAENSVHIALASNRRYVPGLLATLSSMVLASRCRERLAFHVLSEDLADEDERAISSLASRCGATQPVSFLHPDMGPISRTFKGYKGSHAAFVRLFLCDLLPEEDWVIYADVDTLWFRDPCDLWEERDSAVSVLWSPDCPSIARGVRKYSLAFNPKFDERRYACSGVILMNLRRMREIGFVRKSLDFVARWGTPFFVDQDILNAVCIDDARLLDRRWDCMMPDRDAVESVVVHCNGLGGHFDIPMKSWRPSYYVWYRFYADVVLGDETIRVASLPKRLLFWALGSFYPRHSAIAFLCRLAHPRWTDQIERTLFFAWLWRHAKWWRKWEASAHVVPPSCQTSLAQLGGRLLVNSTIEKELEWHTQAAVRHRTYCVRPRQNGDR